MIKKNICVYIKYFWQRRIIIHFCNIRKKKKEKYFKMHPLSLVIHTAYKSFHFHFFLSFRSIFLFWRSIWWQVLKNVVSVLYGNTYTHLFWTQTLIYLLNYSSCFTFQLNFFKVINIWLVILLSFFSLVVLFISFLLVTLPTFVCYWDVTRSRSWFH